MDNAFLCRCKEINSYETIKKGISKMSWAHPRVKTFLQSLQHSTTRYQNIAKGLRSFRKRRQIHLDRFRKKRNHGSCIGFKKLRHGSVLDWSARNTPWNMPCPLWFHRNGNVSSTFCWWILDRFSGKVQLEIYHWSFCLKYRTFGSIQSCFYCTIFLFLH